MTAAAEMDGHLPKEVVQERFDRLVALQEDISFEQNLRAVGRVEEVVVEGTSKRDAGRLTGRTRTNKLVHFEGEGLDEGARARVSIVDAHRHHLDGELLGAGAKPARRSMSLPLVSTTASEGCASCN
jgi:tRNA-2-methylthio-N6-dimethylallyladenosine synthase